MEDAGFDFLDWLGPDTSAIVFTLLDHPADLARASAVSRSWRRFVVANGFSKIQCLRLCPDASNFTRVGVQLQPNAAAADSLDHQQHKAYMNLSHGLVSPPPPGSIIRCCIGASTTDRFPAETIQNTLEPSDLVGSMLSYWSSAGHMDPAVPESLFYTLRSDLCLVHTINIRPYQAIMQEGNPIYSAKYVRFRMGYPKTSIQSQLLVSDYNEGQLAADDDYIWMYTSPQFPMLQENSLQSFKLPRPVLCIGGVVKIELLGRVQKQEMDDLYYICVCHVQIVGNPLPRELGVAPYDKGVVLKYYPDSRRSDVCQGESSRDDGRKSPSKWRNLATRIWHSGPARGIGWNQAIFVRLFGAHDASEEAIFERLFGAHDASEEEEEET